MDIEEDDEKYSPDLYSTPRRDDSEGSWTASSQDREQDQIKHNLSKDMMFLVSLGSLMSLFTCCRNDGCNAEVLMETVKPVKVGAGLRLHAQCRMGHNTTFSTCEFLNKGRSTIIDVKISTLQLITGLNMSQMFEFFHKLNVAVACRSTMYTLQSVFVNPIVYTYWNSMRQALMEKFRMSGKPINISGDGQFDSPGFNARYCFYSVIEATTNKVLDFYVADKSQTEYSSRMEPFATKMLLARLYKEKIEVKVCTTDRSGQLKSLMKEVNEARKQKGLTPIKHTFDVWHYVKAVIKDIYTASKLKKCAALAGWSRSIKNMLWYSFSECKGDADLLREMILSIPLHVSGVHFFPQNRLFQRCLHGDLSTERAKPWLKAGSLSMRKLVLALRGPRDCRFKDLAYMTEFQHTGTNESLNALHNVYLRKSTAFGHPQAIVRACLTSIDHNSNAERQLALDVDGDERYTISSTRDGQTYTAKAIKEPKDTTWRDTILDEVVQAVRCNTVPKVQIPTDEHLKLYHKKRAMPEKSFIIAMTKESRRFRALRNEDKNA